MASTQQNTQQRPPTLQTVSTTVLESLQKLAEATSRAEARLRFLNVRHLPDSSSFEEGGWLLGFNVPEMEILDREGLLPVIGKPKPNGKKKLATAVVLANGANPEWLEKAHEAVRRHWLEKNSHNQQQTKPKTERKHDERARKYHPRRTRRAPRR